MKMIWLLPLFTLTACNSSSLPSSDQKMNQQQEQLSAEAASEVGMPAIRNFQEKRMMKMILELRDTAITTVTYMVTYDGRLMKVCDSIGYGLPYSTQYTNPQKSYDRSCPGTGCSVTALPQADPNGLFSPSSAEGTWVLCHDPVSSKLMPVYIEPRVIVSPFPIGLTPIAAR